LLNGGSFANLVARMKSLPAFWIALVLLGTAGADPRSGPGKTTLAEEPWGTVYCADGCRVTQDERGTWWRLETPQGPVSVQRRPGGWLIQASNQNLRLDDISSTPDQKEYRILFNAAQYRLQQSPTKFSWIPGEGAPIDYQIEDQGRALEGSGPQGKLSVAGDPSEGIYRISSQVGETVLTVKAEKTEVKGPAPGAHPYLQRGIYLDNQVVGILINLPTQRALPCLGWELTSTISSRVPFADRSQTRQPARPDPLNLSPKPFEEAPTIEQTLNKKPGNEWTYPAGSQQIPSEPLQAIQAPKGTDPFKPVEAPKGTDPLQAVGAPKGQDPLNLNRKPFSKDRSIFEIQRDAKGAIPPP